MDFHPLAIQYGYVQTAGQVYYRRLTIIQGLIQGSIATMCDAIYLCHSGRYSAYYWN